MAIDVDHFQKHLQYTTTATLERVVGDLKSIAELDQQAQQQKKQLGRRQGWYVAGLLVSFLLTFLFLANEVFPLAALTAIAAVASLVGAIVYGQRLAPWKKLDVVDFRYQLPQRVLDMMQRDMDSTAPVAIALDFTPLFVQTKCANSRSHPYRAKWTRDFYEDPWMALKGTLLDGTSFDLALTEFWTESHGYKISASGKRKHKRKTKPKGILLSLTLEFSRKRYGAVSILQEDVLAAIRLPDEQAQVKSIRVSDRKILLQVKLMPEPWVKGSPVNRHTIHAIASGVYVPQEKIYPAIASMFLSLYHVLNLAQKLSKAR